MKCDLPGCSGVHREGREFNPELGDLVVHTWVVSLDDRTLFDEPWRDAGTPRGELLDELRRCHLEIDRWRRCASRWRALFLRIEAELGRVLEGVEEPPVVISDWARTDGRHIDNVPIVGERL